MKVVAINGSPRRNGNCAAMLSAALSAYSETDCEVVRYDLFRMKFSGCISCFQCKKLGGKSLGRCALKDELTSLLSEIIDADVFLLAAPIYYADVPGLVKSFLERLLFPANLYRCDYRSAYEHGPVCGLIFTMNAPDPSVYKQVFDRYANQFRTYIGDTELLYACDTMQFNDYSLYSSCYFDAKHKQQVHANVFPEDCRKAELFAKRLYSLAAAKNAE